MVFILLKGFKSLILILKSQFSLFLVFMNTLNSILHKPYPLEERKWAQVKLALIFGVVVFLFLFLFNPFGNKSNILLNAGYAGLLTFFAILFIFILLFPLFPHYFKEEGWSIGREIIFTLIVITTIATANIIAGSIFWGIKLSAFNWLRMIFYTAVIGIAPATTSILINQARLLKKYRKETEVINKHLSPLPMVEPATPYIPETAAIIKNSAPVYITIEAENAKDNLVIESINFLAAASADNYVKIFYCEKAALKTSIVRTTLKKVEDNTSTFPVFFRCHRTAIVNLSAVENLSGTAQGYRLHLKYLHDTIPVSRNLNQVVKEKLAAIRP